MSLAGKVNGFKMQGYIMFFQLNSYAFASPLFSSKRLRSLSANKVIPFMFDMGG